MLDNEFVQMIEKKKIQQNIVEKEDGKYRKISKNGIMKWKTYNARSNHY